MRDALLSNTPNTKFPKLWKYRESRLHRLL